MSNIMVEFAQLQEIGKECATTAKKIQQAKEDFQSSVNKLDWEVKSKANIRGRSVKLSNRLNSIAISLIKYNSFVRSAYSRYADLENYQNGLNEVGDVKPYSPDASVSVSPTNKGDEDQEKTLLEIIIDKIGDVMKYLDKYSDKETGIIAHICALISTTFEIGREGVKSVEELISSVLKLVSNEFDLLTDFLDKENAEGFGVAATLFSMCSEMLDLAQKDIGELFQDSGALIRDVVGLCEDFLQGNSKLNKALYPIAAIGGIISRAIGDGFEFFKDGDFSIQDTARLLLDSGLEGASNWINLLTKGVIDIDVDKAGDCIMDACYSVHDFMERNNWPTWAKVVGSIVGSPVTLVIGIGNMFKGENVAAVL